MNKLTLILALIVLVEYTNTQVVTAPATIFSGETYTVTFTYSSGNPTAFTNLKYTPTGGSATNFGSCAAVGKVITCTGVKITVTADQDALPIKSDANPAVDIGTIAVKIGQALSTVAPETMTAKTEAEVTLTFAQEYAAVPIIKALNATSVTATGCAKDTTTKTIVKCKFNFTTAGSYVINHNEVNSTKKIEVSKGSHLIASLSLVFLALLF